MEQITGQLPHITMPMKTTPRFDSLLRHFIFSMAVLCWVHSAKAVPYASGITNIILGGSNYVQFIMNEGGANVGIVFEDSSSNLISTNLPRGRTNFFLGTHTG